jgi:hypothetical protein
VNAGGVHRRKERTMAGIKNALQRVMDHRNEGVVVAIGVLQENLKCTCGEKESCYCCKPTKYIIVRLSHDNGLITQYDSGSDIHIDPELKVGGKTILIINDNWNATWTPLHPAE